MNRWTALIGTVLVGLFLASTVIIVDTDEVAVVYRFGAIHRVVSPGLSAHLPNPIEHSERLEVTKIRTIELAQIWLLTADFNLVELKPVLQYTIKDPKDLCLVLCRARSGPAAARRGRHHHHNGPKPIDSETFEAGLASTAHHSAAPCRFRCCPAGHTGGGF